MRHVDCESLETVLWKRNEVIWCKTPEDIIRFVKTIWGVPYLNEFQTPSKFNNVLDEVIFKWWDISRITKVYGLQFRILQILNNNSN